MNDLNEWWKWIWLWNNLNCCQSFLHFIMKAIFLPAGPDTAFLWRRLSINPLFHFLLGTATVTKQHEESKKRNQLCNESRHSASITGSVCSTCYTWETFNKQLEKGLKTSSVSLNFSLAIILCAGFVWKWPWPFTYFPPPSTENPSHMNEPMRGEADMKDCWPEWFDVMLLFSTFFGIWNSWNMCFQEFRAQHSEPPDCVVGVLTIVLSWMVNNSAKSMKQISRGRSN